jgi:hypothetical protein
VDFKNDIQRIDLDQEFSLLLWFPWRRLASRPIRPCKSEETHRRTGLLEPMRRINAFRRLSTVYLRCYLSPWRCIRADRDMRVRTRPSPQSDSAEWEACQLRRHGSLERWVLWNLVLKLNSSMSPNSDISPIRFRLRISQPRTRNGGIIR